jgi:hypothetical protein
VYELITVNIKVKVNGFNFGDLAGKSERNVNDTA